MLRRMEDSNGTNGQNPSNGAVARALSGALERLPLGVMLVDGAHRVLAANRTAQRVLVEQDGLGLRADALSAFDADEQVQLAEHIAVATETDNGIEGGIVRISRPSGRRALELAITPVPGESFALVYVFDHAEAATPDPRTLGTLYGLSAAEQRLAAMLADGLSLDRIADACGVTLNTARDRLKNVFAKTGTRRQAELVRLVMASPARLQLD